MRHAARTSVFIFLLLLITPTISVHAASRAYNDPHGRWSVILPDTYTQTHDHYDQGDEQRPGFSALVMYTSRTSLVSVGYRECCRPDDAKRLQITQNAFDAVQKAHPDATMGPDG